MVRMRMSKRQRKDQMELQQQKHMSAPGTMSLNDLSNFRDLAMSVGGGDPGSSRKGRRGSKMCGSVS